jgi:hypothetical protein
VQLGSSGVQLGSSGVQLGSSGVQLGSSGVQWGAARGAVGEQWSAVGCSRGVQWDVREVQGVVGGGGLRETVESTARTSQNIMAEAAAVLVHRNAFAEYSLAWYADPALNPNQPNHSSAVPSMTCSAHHTIQQPPF